MGGGLAAVREGPAPVSGGPAAASAGSPSAPLGPASASDPTVPEGSVGPAAASAGTPVVPVGLAAASESSAPGWEGRAADREDLWTLASPLFALVRWLISGAVGATSEHAQVQLQFSMDIACLVLDLAAPGSMRVATSPSDIVVVGCVCPRMLCWRWMSLACVLTVTAGRARVWYVPDWLARQDVAHVCVGVAGGRDLLWAGQALFNWVVW